MHIDHGSFIDAHITSVQVPALQEWNLSSVVCPRALKQNSHDSHAKHARHSRHYNKTLEHHTGPKKDVTALNLERRHTKTQAALQLQNLTAMYGPGSAAALQLMSTTRVCKHQTSPKVHAYM